MKQKKETYTIAITFTEIALTDTIVEVFGMMSMIFFIDVINYIINLIIWNS